MGLRWVLALVMATVLAAPAAAEFYRYRDKNGTIRYTDNLAEVPPEQRADLKTYREVVSSPPTTAFPETDPSGQAPEPAATVSAEADEERRAAEETAARLRQRQEALIREYEALQKERAALAQKDGQRVNNAQQARYAEAVEALNAKIRDYQQRREAYEQEVQAHNARMARQAAAETAPATEP